jgi:hypothetical protein
MAQGLLPHYVSRYDLIDGYYWWLVEHHNGGGSTRYARMCRMQRYYRPSRRAHSPATPEAQGVYNALCDREGCQHARQLSHNEEG